MQALFHSFGVIDVWQLIGATMVFLMLPGPGTFCVLSCSAKHGLRGGFIALSGLMLGDVMLMFLAAIGVSALLHANPVLFNGMQYLGAAYLAYLGIGLLLAKAEGGRAALPFSGMAHFRRGFFVTLMNPKAIIFYMAFFPQFIDPVTQQGAATFLTMGALICTCTLFYGSLLVLTGNAAARSLSRHRTIAALGSRAAGAILIGFGIKLTTN